MKPEEVKIVFPLDVSSMEEAVVVLKDVAEHVDVIKIGHEFLWAESNHFAIRFVKAMAPDKEVFADPKLIDIPNSVKGGAVGITKLAAGLTKAGVDYFNVMAIGGGEAIRLAAEETRKVADELGIKRPKIIAVLLLTSLGFTEIMRMGFSPAPDFIGEHTPNAWPLDKQHEFQWNLGLIKGSKYHEYLVIMLGEEKAKEFEQDFMSQVTMNLAEIAVEAGADILLSSPREAPVMHAKWPEVDLASPGLRLPDDPIDDQVRTLTPKEAVLNGVKYLIMGRPIRKPSGGRTRQQTIELIRQDIAQALGGGAR